MTQKTYYDTKEAVDLETGERIAVEEGERLLKEKKTKPQTINVRGNKFMKLNIEATAKMYRELTPTEITMVMGLVRFVSYTDCCLRIDGRGELMDANDISRELGLDKRKTYRLLASLEKKGVIGYHITGSILTRYKGKLRKVYTVNPFIYCRGRKVNASVYEYYRKSGWRQVDI